MWSAVVIKSANRCALTTVFLLTKFLLCVVWFPLYLESYTVKSSIFIPFSPQKIREISYYLLLDYIKYKTINSATEFKFWNNIIHDTLFLSGTLLIGFLVQRTKMYGVYSFIFSALAAGIVFLYIWYSSTPAALLSLFISKLNLSKVRFWVEFIYT